MRQFVPHRKLLPVICSICIGIALVALAFNAQASFDQGFETDTSGWIDYNGSTVTRVASGTSGVSAFEGNYYALVTPGGYDSFLGNDVGSYTKWGGYSSVFPAGGYTTSVAIYLNMDAGLANDTRFDWDSSISDSSGGFRRDFIFNAGFYNDNDATGNGNRFVIDAATNGGRSSSNPKGTGSYTIASTGWYVFTHHFYDDGGVLAVDLSISDDAGNVLHSWTLSDPSDLISGIGGNHYGWFDTEEVPQLAFDESKLTLAAVPESTTMFAGLLLLLPLGAGALRILRRGQHS